MAYQMAIAQQAPKIYGEMKAAGTLQEHLEERAQEAEALFDHVMDKLKKSEGSIDENSAMRAREIVYHEIIQFPE